MTPGEDDPDAAADPEDRREQADPAGHLLGGKLIADDAESKREDPAGHALEKRAAISRDKRARYRPQQGAEGEYDQGPEQQPLLAVHVTEAADDRGSDRGGEQVAGEQPGDAGLGGMEVVLHGRQRRDDQRAQHRVGQPAQGEHGQCHVRVGSVCALRGHLAGG